MLPTIEEYKDSFRLPSEYFKTLSVEGVSSKFDANEPYFVAGGFACVFKLKDKLKQENNFWAFKCFLQDDPHRNERLRILSDFLQSRTENYFLKTHFYTDELWVCSQLAGDGEYPTLAMPWIEGQTLGEYVHEAAKTRNTEKLQRIYDEFLRLAHFLLSNDFAHGDLKHDNILVDKEENLILIDYDGMYLPELTHFPSQELGGHGYQHPKRTTNDWGRHIDDFSILVILLSLRAYIVLPSLIDDHKSENLLLTSHDLQNPMQSQILQQLWQQDDEPLKHLLGMLFNSLAQNNLRVLEIGAFVERNLLERLILFYEGNKKPKDFTFDIHWWNGLDEKWQKILREESELTELTTELMLAFADPTAVTEEAKLKSGEARLQEVTAMMRNRFIKKSYFTVESLVNTSNSAVQTLNNIKTDYNTYLIDLLDQEDLKAFFKVTKPSDVIKGLQQLRITDSLTYTRILNELEAQDIEQAAYLDTILTLTQETVKDEKVVDSNFLKFIKYEFSDLIDVDVEYDTSLDEKTDVEQDTGFTIITKDRPSISHEETITAKVKRILSSLSYIDNKGITRNVRPEIVQDYLMTLFDEVRTKKGALGGGSIEIEDIYDVLKNKIDSFEKNITSEAYYHNKVLMDYFFEIKIDLDARQLPLRSLSTNIQNNTDALLKAAEELSDNLNLGLTTIKQLLEAHSNLIDQKDPLVKLEEYNSKTGEIQDEYVSMILNELVPKLVESNAERNKLALNAIMSAYKSSSFKGFVFAKVNEKKGARPSKIVTMEEATILGSLSSAIQSMINGKRNNGKAIKSTKLFVEDKQLTELPAWIGALTDLEKLYLNDNLLEVLPKSIKNLRNLKELNASNNQLKEIPNQIQNLKTLETLDWSGNQLTVLPNWIGNLVNLTRLRLANNQFKELPNDIEKLRNLTSLSLINNPLPKHEKERIKKLLPNCQIHF